MYKTYDRIPDTLSAELEYRRSRLAGHRSTHTQPAPFGGRWRRRRAPRTD